MAMEPSKEVIETVMAVTDLPGSQAVEWLKAYGNDANNAISAFYDDPHGLPAKVASIGWDESPFHSDKTEYGPQNQPSFSVHPPDSLNPGIFDGTISRPPSRISNRVNDITTDSNKHLTLAEQEDIQMKEAMAMSMSQTLPSQEVGVTDTSRPHFGPTNRNDHDSRNWSVAIAGHHAREILDNPEPADRKREPGVPAFLKPVLAKNYLPSLITVLHAIPMAREALLARHYTREDYGHNNEWWDGMPIQAPKIVDLENQIQDSDWDEIIFESQRLMAFLDLTDRAYGSTDVVGNLEGVRQRNDPERGLLETWRDIVLQASPEAGLADVFKSYAVCNVPDAPETNGEETFYILDLPIDNELADTGQTLYEAFDDILWRGYDPQDSAEMYLDTVGDIITFRIERQNEAENGLGVKIPSVWYVDRYLRDSVPLAREMRLEKVKVKENINKVEQMQNKLRTLTNTTSQNQALEGNDLLNIAKSYFAKPGKASTSANGLKEGLKNSEPFSQSTTVGYDHIVEELEAVAERVFQKSRALERSKEQAMEKLRELSKLYTQPSDDPEKAPHRRYTLRGVSTNHHTTYVLEKTRPDDDNDILSAGASDWQWWRIDFSNSGTRPISWEKVREVEVLKAAKDESRTALLVYASDKAVSFDTEDNHGNLPTQLRNFVRADNLSFAAELDKSNTPKSTSPPKRKVDDTYDNYEPNWGGYQSTELNNTFDSSTSSNASKSLPVPYSPSKPPPPLPRSSLSRQSPNKNRSRNIPQYDDTNPPRLADASSSNDSMSIHFDDVDINEKGDGQEMQERSRGRNLLSNNDLRGEPYSLGDYIPEIIMEDGDEDGKEKADQV